jgi:hypothetical protein
MQLDKEKLLSFPDVLRESRKDDKNKVDIYCKMGELTFLTRDIKEYDADEEEEDGKKVKTSLHAQISVPHGGQRVRLGFSMNSFRQFIQSQLGIPAKYLMKCPAGLAKDQVDYWKATMADRDLLIRARIGGELKESYARAVLGATYGKLDNTPLLTMVKEVAEEANMSIWRYDMPDTSMHVKAILGDNVNMGTKTNPDPVHFGFHMGTSETGNRMTTLDIMTFRLVCTNGLITLVDGHRLIQQQHRGDLDIGNFRTEIRTKMNEAILKQDAVFGKFQALKESKTLDVFEEARAMWSKFQLPATHRNMLFNLLTDKYKDGTRWDIVNAATEVAQSLENPDIRMKIEEGAGKYMLLEAPILG